MNTVKQITKQTTKIVNSAALKISTLDINPYRHFVFNIEDGEPKKKSGLEVAEFGSLGIKHKAYNNQNKIINTESYTTVVNFLASKDLDNETLLLNIVLTLEKMLLNIREDENFLVSISIKNSRLNISDFGDYFDKVMFSGFKFFYRFGIFCNDANDVLTLFEKARLKS